MSAFQSIYCLPMQTWIWINIRNNTMFTFILVNKQLQTWHLSGYQHSIWRGLWSLKHIYIYIYIYIYIHGNRPVLSWVVLYRLRRGWWPYNSIAMDQDISLCGDFFVPLYVMNSTFLLHQQIIFFYQLTENRADIKKWYVYVLVQEMKNCNNTSLFNRNPCYIEMKYFIYDTEWIAIKWHSCRASTLFASFWKKRGHWSNFLKYEHEFKTHPTNVLFAWYLGAVSI